MSPFRTVIHIPMGKVAKNGKTGNNMQSLEDIANLETVLSESMQSIQQLKLNINRPAAQSKSLSKPQSVWQTHYSVAHDRHYYYNVETGESRWEPEEEEEIEASQQSDTTTSSLANSNLYMQSNFSVSPIDMRNSVRQGNDGLRLFSDDSVDFDGESSSQPSKDPPFSGLSLSSSAQRTKRPSIAERSAQQLQAKKTKEEALRQHLEEKKNEGVRTAPVITSKSKQLQRGVQDMLAWEDSRRAKIEVRQRQQQEEQQKSFTGRPTVTKVAEKLNHGKGAGQSVEARLLEQEEQRQLKWQQKIEDQRRADREAAVPQVAPRSAQLRRPAGDVAERLYSLAARDRIPDGDSVGAASATATGQRVVPHDSQTGQRLFQPKINSTSEQLSVRTRPAQVPVEDLLTYRGQQYAMRAKQRELRTQLSEQMEREKSRLNPISEKLVQSRGDRTSDRLSKPIGAVKQSTLETIAKPTFQPKVSEKSKEIAAQSLFSVNGVEAAPSGRRDCIDDESYWISSVDVNEGAFSESGEPQEYVPRNAATKQHDSRASSDMYLKSQKWAEAREKKLARDRASRAKESNQECSFKPKVGGFSASCSSVDVS